MAGRGPVVLCPRIHSACQLGAIDHRSFRDLAGNVFSLDQQPESFGNKPSKKDVFSIFLKLHVSLFECCPPLSLEGHPFMLLRPRKPRLVLTEQSSTELNGVCAGCKKAFHAYIRTTKAAAVRRLERNFRLHYRLAHRALEARQPKEIREFDLPAAC